MQTNYTKLKTWFRHLLHHPARKWGGPIQQLPGPVRGQEVVNMALPLPLPHHTGSSFSDNSIDIIIIKVTLHIPRQVYQETGVAYLSTTTFCHSATSLTTVE